MLTSSSLERILARLPSLSVGVVGDLFLDRYLELDDALTEPSIETGLDAYQVVRVRSSPGAAGTVVNNLVALGVGRVLPLGVIGDDGEGYELRQALGKLGTVESRYVFSEPTRRTPTYTKPMLQEAGRPPRELNRLDIKNRIPMPRTTEDRLLDALDDLARRMDALIVLDQVSEADCGVVTERVRERLAVLGQAMPDKIILADSRERIGLFQSVWLKPNEHECLQAVRKTSNRFEDVVDGARSLAERVGRPIFCTCGDKGILVSDPRPVSRNAVLVPAYPVRGPIDIVGAGDSSSAGIACAVASGATLEEAAAFGNLVASITIQQIGTTGTATPEQVRERWREIG